MTTPTYNAGATQRAQVRVVGSNYTTFLYQGKPIAYLEIVADSGQAARGGGGGAGFEFIHPLGYRHPIDIVTSRILSGGTVTLTIRELWNKQIWQQLAGLSDANDIVEIFEKLAATPNYVTMAKIITPPSGQVGRGPRYGKVYHRCVIVNIDDSDTINIGDLSVNKTITVAYTHTTKL